MEDLTKIELGGIRYTYGLKPADHGRLRLVVVVGEESWTEPGALGARQALVERVARMLERETMTVIWAHDDVQAAGRQIQKEREERQQRERELERRRQEAHAAQVEQTRKDEAAAKALRTKKQAVEIVGETVEAFVAGGLAHHRQVGARDSWSVSHVRSGLAAGHFATKTQARTAHALLLGILPSWDVPADAIPADATKQAGELMRRLRV